MKYTGYNVGPVAVLLRVLTVHARRVRFGDYFYRYFVSISTAVYTYSRAMIAVGTAVALVDGNPTCISCLLCCFYRALLGVRGVSTVRRQHGGETPVFVPWYRGPAHSRRHSGGIYFLFFIHLGSCKFSRRSVSWKYAPVLAVSSAWECIARYSRVSNGENAACSPLLVVAQSGKYCVYIAQY